MMPVYSAKQIQEMAHNVACDVVASHNKNAPKFLRACAKAAKQILADTKAVHTGKPTPCKKHKNYLAKRRPVNGCMDCLKYYNQVQYK